jgi:simple sugar transport system permease protein
MIWGGIVGVLKAVTGAHDVVTTIMLNYVAQSLVLYLIEGNGPLQLPGHSASSPTIGQGGWLPTLIPSDSEFLGLPGSVYRVHAGIFIALAVAGLFAFLLSRTSLGYEIRAVGQSQKAARYAGISIRRTFIVTMLISGALAGLAGAVQVAGVRHNLTDLYKADTTGFDAIAVALLGQGAALGVVLSAILFGALHASGQFVQDHANVSANLVDVLQALILFGIAANFLATLRLRLPSIRQRGERQAQPASPDDSPSEPLPFESADVSVGVGDTARTQT